MFVPQAKFECALKHPGIKIVTPDWITDSIKGNLTASSFMAYLFCFCLHHFVEATNLHMTEAASREYVPQMLKTSNQLNLQIEFS